MDCSSFLSVPGDATWPVPLRAALYSLGLAYCFLGLATITRKYMDAMETIVQHERTVTRRDNKTGALVTSKQRLWNPTIADITLLALGTSAPAISLAIIAAVKQLGSANTGADVGTGTMFGGAAFNFFAILACCILLPRGGAVKRVANFGVFLVELIWSIWAYVWLYIVLQVWTPNEVTVLEAVLTVLHMPLLMLHAYAQDRHWPAVSFPRSWTDYGDLDAPGQGHEGTVGKGRANKKTSTHTNSSTGGVLAQDEVGKSLAFGRPPSAQRLADLVKDFQFVDDEEDDSHEKDLETGTGDIGESERATGGIGDSAQKCGAHDGLQLAPGGGKSGEVQVFNSAKINVSELGKVSEEQEKVFRRLDSEEALSLEWESRSMADSRFSSAASGLASGSSNAGSAAKLVSEKLGSLEELRESDARSCSLRSTASVESAPSVAFLWREQICQAAMLRPEHRSPPPAPCSSHSVPSGPEKRGREGAMHEGEGEEGSSGPHGSGPCRRVLSLLWRVLVYFWRVLFALVLPPPRAGGGWPAFLLAICVIASVAALVIELTNLLGCVLGISPFLLSITLLAAGTSIPNIMASAIATLHSPTADSAIANINASNCINVYLGLGVPWIISTAYNAVQSSGYSLDGGDLGPCLIVYLGTLLAGVALLLGRRWGAAKGELGGNRMLAWGSSLGLLFLWGLYCSLTILIFYGKVW